jgi:hypothetical protein
LIIDQDTINEEVVSVTNRSGTTLTVSRAQDGTVAVAHSAGAAVNHGVSARDFDEPNAFLNAGGTVAGPTVVSANSSSTALEVRQTGAGNAFVVEDSTNPDATPFVVDASGNVGIGTSTPDSLLYIAGSQGNIKAISGNSTAGAGSRLIAQRSRGSVTSPSAVSAGDSLLIIGARGYGATTFPSGDRATVAAFASENHTDSAHGTYITVSTTPDGSTTLTERMRIDNAGLITGSGTSLGAWTAYTPTVSSGTGTITSYTSSGYYTRIGKIVHAIAYVTITNNGTGASYVNVDLPLAARNVTATAVGSGREDGVTGKSLQWRAIAGTGVGRAYFYDNTYPGANNAVLMLSITYETSA